MIASLTLAVAFNAVADPKSKQHRKDVAISVIKSTKPHIHRSAIPIVSAIYDSDMSQLEVEFNDDLGIVRICVLNSMFQTVALYECDTQSEPLAVLLCSLDDESNYTIQMTSKEFEAVGYLN